MVTKFSKYNLLCVFIYQRPVSTARSLCTASQQSPSDSHKHLKGFPIELWNILTHSVAIAMAKQVNDQDCPLRMFHLAPNTRWKFVSFGFQHPCQTIILKPANPNYRYSYLYLGAKDYESTKFSLGYRLSFPSLLFSLNLPLPTANCSCSGPC